MDMDRRRFAVTAISSIGILVGCDSEKPSSTASLTNNGNIHKALKTLGDAIANMEGDIGDFDTENWREVVPRVKDTVADVSSSFHELLRALDVSD